MIQRKGNNPPTTITLSGTDTKVTDIKYVYTVIEIKEGDLNMGGNMGSFFFSLPYNCKVADVFGLDGAYLDKWALLKYNGERRAKEGLFVDSGSYWELVGANETLQRGTGYVLQVAGLTKSQKDNGIHLYFPSADGNIGTLSNATETTTLAPMTYTGPNHSANNIDHSKSDINWYAVGVPGYGEMNATFTTNGSEIDTWYTSGGSTITSGNFFYDWSYNNGSQKYTATAAASTTFKPTFAYIFQWAGTINWNSAAVTPQNKIVARPAAAENNIGTLLELQLLRDNTMQDRTYIQMVEQATAGFDVGHDLTKMQNSGDNLYTRCYNGNLHNDLAANNLPLADAEIPLIVVASETADYTFHKSTDYEGIDAIIYDRTEDRYIDLGFRDYTVCLPKGTYEERFTLQVKKQTDVTTAICNTDSNFSVRLSDGKLFIGGIDDNTDIELYDLVGHLLYRATVSNGESIPAPDNHLFLLRLNDQTQIVSGY